MVKRVASQAPQESRLIDIRSQVPPWLGTRTPPKTFAGLDPSLPTELALYAFKVWPDEALGGFFSP